MKSTTRLHTELIRGKQDLRKIFHISIGMFGFLYPFMSRNIILAAWIIALFCAWFLPRYVKAYDVFLTPDEKRKKFSPAMISYAAVMLLATLIFGDKMKDSAVVLLSVIAFGDGFAGLIGMNQGGTAIPYNSKKTISGTLAFIFFGTIGALVMFFFLAVFTVNVPGRIGLGSLPIFRTLIVVVVSAIVETIPWKIPDNVSVGIAAIIALLLTMNLYH